MLSQQEEDHRQSSASRLMSPRVTPLTNDHVHIQHRNFNDNAACGGEQIRQSGDASSSDDIAGGIYGRVNDENNSSNAMYAPLRFTNAHISRQLAGQDFVASGRSDGKGDCVNDASCGKCKMTAHEKRTWDAGQQRRVQEQPANSQQSKNGDTTYGWRNAINASRQDFQSYSRGYEHNSHLQQSSNHESYNTHDYLPARDVGYLTEDFKVVPKRLIRNDGKI